MIIDLTEKERLRNRIILGNIARDMALKINYFNVYYENVDIYDERIVAMSYLSKKNYEC